MVFTLLALAIQHAPSAKRIVVEHPASRFDEAFADSEPAALQKADRVIRQISLTPIDPPPTPVTTVRIPVTPEIAPSPVDPPVRKKTYASNDDDNNICTQHHLRKVWTPDGRSWRCRR